MDLHQHGLVIDDRLGRDGCANLPSCREIVRTLRQGFINYELTKRLFMSYGPLDALAIPDAVCDSGIEALAAIDLEGLSSDEVILERMRVRTSKKGRVNREIDRARKAGYVVKRFPYALHIPDIVEIHHSKPIRNQRPMKENYLKSVEEMGGAPTAPIALETHACPYHYHESWGVFQAVEGYRQGAVTTNEKLVGYVRLRRVGNHAWYNKIMGHADHLNAGVMYLLHFEVLAHFARTRPHGLRHLVYHQYKDPRGDNTLFEWKHKVLFEPRWAIYEDDRPWSFDASGSAISTTIKRRVVEAVLAGDRSAVDANERDNSLSQERVRRWTRSWLRSSSDKSLAFTFDPGETPGFDDLLRLSTNDFPLETLAGIDSAALFTPGTGWGIDVLPPFAEAGMENVVVTVGGDIDIAALRAPYPDHWTFRQDDAKGLASPPDCAAGSVDLVLFDPPPHHADIAVLDHAAPFLRLTRKRLIVGMERSVLQRLGQKVDGHVAVNAGETAAAFGALHGIELSNPAVLYRHRRGGGCYWFTADLA